VYLGMDIGTSSVKAVLVNDAGAIVAAASRELALSHPAPLWSEQDPDAWVDAAIDAVDDLAATHPRETAQVRGIGLAGQMHGATMLGADGQPLRPAILWNDGRSHAECAELELRCPSLHAISGNLAMAGFTAPKLMWVARHEPDVFARVAHVLLPKAYVRYRLTGEMVEDMSDAAGTLWLDVGRRCWSETILEATGLGLHHMPRLVEGSQPSAVLSADFARRWGMAPGVVVAGGAGDNAASAIGLGAIAPGDAFLSLGTSGVLFRVTERFAPAPRSAVHAFCHALPGLWHQMGVMLSAAASLGWLARILATASARRTMMPRLPAPSSVCAAQPDAMTSFRRCSKVWPSPCATTSLRWAAPVLRSRRSISWAADRARRCGRRSSPTCSAFRSTASRRARSVPRSELRGSAGWQPHEKSQRKYAPVRAGSRASCRALRRWPPTMKPIGGGENFIPRSRSCPRERINELLRNHRAGRL